MTTAYKAAGYAWQTKEGKPVVWIGVAANALVKRPVVAARIAELKSLRDLRAADREAFTLDWLRAQLMELHETARKADDLTNANRALESIARTMGAFSDGVSLSVNKQREYSEAERTEAKRLAAILVADERSAGVARDSHTADIVGDSGAGPLTTNQLERSRQFTAPLQPVSAEAIQQTAEAEIVDSGAAAAHIELATDTVEREHQDVDGLEDGTQRQRDNQDVAHAGEEQPQNEEKPDANTPKSAHEIPQQEADAPQTAAPMSGGSAPANNQFQE